MTIYIPNGTSGDSSNNGTLSDTGTQNSGTQNTGSQYTGADGSGAQSSGTQDTGSQQSLAQDRRTFRPDVHGFLLRIDVVGGRAGRDHRTGEYQQGGQFHFRQILTND